MAIACSLERLESARGEAEICQGDRSSDRARRSQAASRRVIPLRTTEICFGCHCDVLDVQKIYKSSTLNT